MATKEWLGNARAVAQVRNWVFGGTWEATDINDVTINGNTVSVSAGSATIATLGATLAAALNALTIPEFAEITWSFATATLTATGDEAGKPFSVSITTRDVGGAADSQTIDGTTTSTGTDATAATGPNDVSATANWSGGSLPVDNDTIVIARPVSMLYGLTALSGINAVVQVRSSFWAGGGQIGLAAVNGSGSSAYYEYRALNLVLDGAKTGSYIGDGNGRGSAILNIDFGTGNVDLTVNDTPSPVDATRKAVALFINPGAAADGILEVLSGSVDVCPNAATGKVTARIGYKTNQIGDSIVAFGSGVTHGAVLEMSGGTVEVNSTLTALNKTGGELTINGTGSCATYRNYKGPAYINTTGAFGASVNFTGKEGVTSFVRDMSAKNIDGTFLLAAGAKLHDPHGVCDVFAWKVDAGGAIKDVEVLGPPAKTYTAS
jgi:hypothetical protein